MAGSTKATGTTSTTDLVASDTTDPATNAPVDDIRDVTPRHTTAKDVKRIKAIPFSGGTTVVIRAADFANNGIEHGEVTWDFLVEDFTVVVGRQISAEAAEFLVKNVPSQFFYVEPETPTE